MLLIVLARLSIKYTNIPAQTLGLGFIILKG
jgi:hypothetical protein